MCFETHDGSWLWQFSEGTFRQLPRYNAVYECMIDFCACALELRIIILLISAVLIVPAFQVFHTPISDDSVQGVTALQLFTSV